MHSDESDRSPNFPGRRHSGKRSLPRNFCTRPRSQGSAKETLRGSGLEPGAGSRGRRSAAGRPSMKRPGRARLGLGHLSASCCCQKGHCWSNPVGFARIPSRTASSGLCWKAVRWKRRRQQKTCLHWHKIADLSQQPGGCRLRGPSRRDASPRGDAVGQSGGRGPVLPGRLPLER